MLQAIFYLEIDLPEKTFSLQSFVQENRYCHFNIDYSIHFITVVNNIPNKITFLS